MAFLRKKIRLADEQYIGARWYFVTMCCAERRTEFANLEIAAWIVEQLREKSISNRFAVHAYCAMPNHLHALVLGLDASSDLLFFLKSFKQATAYDFKRRFGRTLWQKRFYDHILRSEDAPERVAGYIWMNPVRQGLCGDPREYPFSGSFVLDWKGAARPAVEWVPPWKGAEPTGEKTKMPTAR